MKRVLVALGVVVALGGVACGEVGDDGAETVQDATTCGAGEGHFVNLNDACKRKVQPSERTRALSCPVVSSDASGFDPIDPHAFDAVASFVAGSPVRVVAAIVRRVDGVPHYQYLSNGHQDDVVQPWSSSKWIGVMAAGAKLRQASSGQVGLTGSVNGHALGDLVTDIATYESRISSSNGTAHWFKNVAGRDFANALVGDWLGRKGEEFRGVYGTELAPYGYTISDANNAKISVPDDEQTGITNLLSMGTELEAMKRLAMWDDESTRLPNLEADDVRTILYGAENPVAYKGEAGGLMRDQAIYMQNAVDIADVEKQSHGRWRIFSKLGYGIGERPGLGNVAEIAHVAYACLPSLDASGAPIPDQGAEFVLAVHATGKTGMATDATLNTLYRRLVQEVILPRAQPRSENGEPLHQN